MEREIVKVQRALVPHDAPWFVQDRKRGRQAMVRPSAAHVKAMGQQLRAYFWATYDRGAWSLIEPAPQREGWAWPR